MGCPSVIGYGCEGVRISCGFGSPAITADPWLVQHNLIRPPFLDRSYHAGGCLDPGAPSSPRRPCSRSGSRPAAGFRPGHVQRALNSPTATVEDMRVDHRRLHVQNFARSVDGMVRSPNLCAARAVTASLLYCFTVSLAHSQPSVRRFRWLRLAALCRLKDYSDSPHNFLTAWQLSSTARQSWASGSPSLAPREIISA